ncbi:hypothetical protein SAMN05421508_103260 [Caenispirillum bisanense]|uniref:Uncharacterized protein n=1 Tax=Caenispirillum bisanense TaxID=414052 RepID=A0A286GEG4_9PROT|nr:hypothetical protein SAMN05421508_103260 [Caenispirillum bisanense]
MAGLDPAIQGVATAGRGAPPSTATVRGAMDARIKSGHDTVKQ